MNTYILCQVRGCQNPYTHNSLGHYCSLCNSYGHGKHECHNKVQKKILLNHNYNVPLMKCEIENCEQPFTHYTIAHVCTFCENVGHQGGNQSVRRCFHDEDCSKYEYFDGSIHCSIFQYKHQLF